MKTTDGTVRLTTAQAIIRWLTNQYIEIDGRERQCEREEREKREQQREDRLHMFALFVAPAQRSVEAPFREAGVRSED